MQKKLLIDASHQEETRIVLLDNNQVEEFDFEAINKKQISGNIFLAKVTRVEPSLQAAFLDYGGNRHGFLAFSEIHPDYYQIPIADKKLLLENTFFNDEEKNEHSEIELLSTDFQSNISDSNEKYYSEDISQVRKFSNEKEPIDKDLDKNLTLWSNKKEEPNIPQKEELDSNYHLNLDIIDDVTKTKTVQNINNLNNKFPLWGNTFTFKNYYKLYSSRLDLRKSYPHLVFILSKGSFGGIEQKPKSCFSISVHCS